MPWISKSREQMRKVKKRNVADNSFRRENSRRKQEKKELESLLKTRHHSAPGWPRPSRVPPSMYSRGKRGRGRGREEEEDRSMPPR